MSIAIESGNPLPAISLPDQFGETHTLDTDIRRIYYHRDRTGDALLKEALQDGGQAVLDRQRAIVIADLRAIPRLVRRLALSSLRERPYTIWLDRDGSSEQLPTVENSVTIIDLDKLQVTAIGFASNADQLRALLAESGTRSTDPHH